MKQWIMLIMIVKIMVNVYVSDFGEFWRSYIRWVRKIAYFEEYKTVYSLVGYIIVKLRMVWIDSRCVREK